MLSDKSSLKSMKPPFLIFSTALAGIGGRDGEITSGGDGAGAVIASDGDDNNDAREGRDQVVAADALVATEQEGDEKSATPAMDDATGSDKVAGVPVGTEPLEPAGEQTEQAVKRDHY